MQSGRLELFLSAERARTLFLSIIRTETSDFSWRDTSATRGTTTRVACRGCEMKVGRPAKRLIDVDRAGRMGFMRRDFVSIVNTNGWEEISATVERSSARVYRVYE